MRTKKCKDTFTIVIVILAYLMMLAAAAMFGFATIVLFKWGMLAQGFLALAVTAGFLVFLFEALDVILPIKEKLVFNFSREIIFHWYRKNRRI